MVGNAGYRKEVDTTPVQASGIRSRLKDPRDRDTRRTLGRAAALGHAVCGGARADTRQASQHHRERFGFRRRGRHGRGRRDAAGSLPGRAVIPQSRVICVATGQGVVPAVRPEKVKSAGGCRHRTGERVCDVHPPLNRLTGSVDGGVG